MAQTNPPQRGVRRQLTERAARDPQFRQLLIDNPRQAVREELGTEIPGEVDISVLEETPTQVYVVLPPRVAPWNRLSDDDLEQVAGGAAVVTNSIITGCS